jgi:large subunit ribosomal protein L28
LISRSGRKGAKNATLRRCFAADAARNIETRTPSTNQPSSAENQCRSLSTGVGKTNEKPFKFPALHSIFYISFPYLCRPKFITIMARVCQVTGKVPVRGNKVSHSNIKTKRRFLPNLQKKRFYLAEEDKWITLKLTTNAIRSINKNGLYSVVKELRAGGLHI